MRVTAFIIIGVAVIYSNLFGQQAYQFPFQNPVLPLEERVNDLVSRMTLEEKVLQLFNQAPAIDRLGVPAYNWWNECLHGVARAGKATVFPQAIGMAATFDQDLMYKVSTAISDEARAKHHNFVRANARSIYMGLTFWSPNINIFRDPRWGRGQETYGEDPYLTGRMAVNFIKGLQGNDPKYLKVIATAKHYAVHSGPEPSRHTDNIYINDRDLNDTYLPAFKVSVMEANVQSIMCAYNRFRDKPCCGSDILLSNILRSKFGFNGYIVSDCGAITDFYTQSAHHIVESPVRAWGWSISTGTDLNCEGSRSFVKDSLEKAIRTGILNESDINVSVKRLFRARFMLGMFDPDTLVAYAQIPMTVVGSEKHLELALKMAEKSLVLLKNDGTLPLKKGNKVALIGPNANNPTILIGNYNGDPIHPVTPLNALKERMGDKNVIYSPGCPIVPGVYTDFQIIGNTNFFHSDKGKLQYGLKAEYYEDKSLGGTPKISRIDPKIDFYWEKSPVNQVVDESFGVKWTGFLIPEESGNYLFSSNLQIKIDDMALPGNGINLDKGKQYKFEAILRVAEHMWESNHQQQFATVSWVNTSHDYHKEALVAAANADVIIFCGGISSNLEGEEMRIETDGFAGGDRTHINLPEIQENLLKELQETGKPIVYINFSGSAVALNWENENLAAIVQAFYPGEATGTALANLLFGDYNPSGRLPVTFYKSVNDIPDFKNYDMQGRTYRYFTGEPLYPFGYGLSYTTFAYSNLDCNETSDTRSLITVTADVKNTGTTDGEEVVQLYISNKTASSIVPIKSLKSFQRVLLKKGEKKTISFSLDPEAFSITNGDAQQIVEPGTYEISVGGSSSGINSLLKTIRLTGNIAVIE